MVAGEKASWEAGVSAPELVVGLVGAVGLDLDRVASHLARALREVAYDSETVALSRLLHSIKWSEPLSGDEHDRAAYINSHQDRGDELRRRTERGDILALLAVATIRARRAEMSTGAMRVADDEETTSRPAEVAVGQLAVDVELDPYRGLKKPLSRFAFILRSLKHPDEARTLRDIYGNRFLLVAAYADDEQTLDDLAAQIAHSRSHAVRQEDREEARRLAERDQADPESDYGQNVRDTYPLADLFLDATSEDTLRAESSRFVELLFASPFQTPRRDEFGMFIASACSLRSAALGRQVGASILDANGAVVSTGTNEVPKAGGGQYWVDDLRDQRDFRYEDGSDSSDTMRRAIIAELLERYDKIGVSPPKDRDGEELTVDKLVPLLKGTRVGNLVEFGRAVHAEMAAITDTARRGVPVAGCTLYTTTFPCHNCARHIVASGIADVVFVAPYAKSLTLNLHRDSVTIGAAPAPHKVRFRQFVGVAPLRYVQLFTMVERKDELGYKATFRPERTLPRDVDLQAFYEHREWRAAVVGMSQALKDARLEVTGDLLDSATYN